MADIRQAVANAIGATSILPNCPQGDRLVDMAKAWMHVMEGQDFEPSHVEAAASRLLKTCRFFPSPAEFLEACRWARQQERDSRPPLSFAPCPELPWRGTPLAERTDRDEILRIRAEAHQRLGMSDDRPHPVTAVDQPKRAPLSQRLDELRSEFEAAKDV